MIRRIRIVSPSGVIDPSLIDQASARLQEWGFEVSEGQHARDRWGRFAGTDEDRFADLREALQDPSVDLVLCARGGYGLQRIIDEVPPITKPILGFSDITALHQAAGLTHQPTLHGVMCKHIATLPQEGEVLQALRKALRGETLTYTFPAHSCNHLGETTAPIVGGNLSVLYGLQGTKFQIQPGAILLIEDIGERLYHIERMLLGLRMSGVLERVSGVLVGQFTDCEDDPSLPDAQTAHAVVAKVLDGYSVPVAFDVPIGHVERNLPVWLNKPAHLSVTQQGVSLII